MAFGDYATLKDDFNRTAVNPLDGSWTNKILPTNGNMRIQDPGNATGAATGICSAWYTGSTPAADCEAYVTMVVKPSAATNARVYLRLQSPGTSGADGYFVQVTTQTGTDTWNIFRLDNGSATSIASGSREFADGEGLGLEAIGTAIAAYVKPVAGSWTLLGSATDGTYGSAGPVGICSQNGGAALDDFSFGDVAAAASTKPKTLLSLGIG